MPKIGVSGPWVAKYNNINGVISYTSGVKLARTTEFSSEISSEGNNDFYSDNSLSETDRTFSSGSLTNSVDGYEQEGSRLILGVKAEPVTIDGEEITELVFDDDAETPYLGYGINIKKRKGGKDFYRAVVYTKIMFSIPSEAATTQGETIEWQTDQLTATIMRDDSPKHRWKREATFPNEDKAIKYIKYCLDIQDAGELAVTSVPGEEIGDTHITVSPSLMPDNSYVYAVAPAVGLPSYDEVMGSAYIEWDGTSDITATTDHKILVVEVDAGRRAKKAGIASVVSNDGGA